MNVTEPLSVELDPVLSGLGGGCQPGSFCTSTITGSAGTMVLNTEASRRSYVFACRNAYLTDLMSYGATRTGQSIRNPQN